MRISIGGLLLGAFALSSFGQAQTPVAHAATTYTVNWPVDFPNDGICDSQCNLREAIIAANANAGTDSIVFALGSPYPLLGVLIDLPAVTEPVVIDGATGGSVRPIVYAMSTVSTGLELAGPGGSTVRNLQLGRPPTGGFMGSGLRLTSDENVAEGVLVSNNYGGVLITGDNNALRDSQSVRNYAGVRIMGNGNVVTGNEIGAPTPDGNFGPGVEISMGASNNTIGGSSPGAGNVISGNERGIHLMFDAGAGTRIAGNLIGVQGDGVTPLGNTYDGVFFESFMPAQTLIGGTGPGEGNVIAYNTAGLSALGNRSLSIRGNSIHTNTGIGIDTYDGGYGEPTPPAVLAAAASSTSGTSCNNCDIDVFTDATTQGRYYVGSTRANGFGGWSLPIGLVGNITATGTDSAGNTSEFSAPLAGSAGPDSDGDGIIDGSDSCPSNFDPTLANYDRNLIDVSPPKAYDDVTRANSDAAGDACDADDDNDGRADSDELAGTGCGAFASPTGPLVEDSDGDRVLDGAECANGTNPNDAQSKPSNAVCHAAGDADGDGVLDSRESCFYNTSNASTNTDGDTRDDGCEIASINADTLVNVIDLQQLAQSVPPSGTAGYIVHFDMNKDGFINVIDLQFVAGRSGPCP